MNTRSMGFHPSRREFFLVCRCVKSVISLVVGAASFSVDSHLLNRILISASVAVHTELLHEQAVLYGCISVLSRCT